MDLPGHRPGFPIWFDVQKSNEQMHKWIQNLEDGLLFDYAVSSVTAEFVTYNPDVKLFSKTVVLFKSSNGGAFTKYSSTNTLKVCILLHCKLPCCLLHICVAPVAIVVL